MFMPKFEPLREPEGYQLDPLEAIRSEIQWREREIEKRTADIAEARTWISNAVDYISETGILVSRLRKEIAPLEELCARLESPIQIER